jgi:cell division septation protein DedD
MQRILNFDEPLASASETEDFELVVGRRQAAALTFLALVVVALCSGASYLAGKAIAPREEAPVPVIKLEPAPPPATEAAMVPPMFPPVTVASAAAVVEAPLFASPVAQAIYIQVGAVDKGVATILAEGLRKHSLDSFVAPGPSDKAFRVLIGPFPDAAAYQKAQAVVDRLGLASFARRYQVQ